MQQQSNEMDENTKPNTVSKPKCKYIITNGYCKGYMYIYIYKNLILLNINLHYIFKTFSMLGNSAYFNPYVVPWTCSELLHEGKPVSSYRCYGQKRYVEIMLRIMFLYFIWKSWILLINVWKTLIIMFHVCT